MSTAIPRRSPPAIGAASSADGSKASLWHSLLAAAAQALVAVILLAVVIGGVAFDAVLKLLTPYLDTFAADAKGAPSIALEMTAWVGTLVGVLWILDVALRFMSRSNSSALDSSPHRQRLELVAGSVLVGLGLVVLLVALDTGWA